MNNLKKLYIFLFCVNLFAPIQLFAQAKNYFVGLEFGYIGGDIEFPTEASQTHTDFALSLSGGYLFRSYRFFADFLPAHTLKVNNTNVANDYKFDYNKLEVQRFGLGVDYFLGSFSERHIGWFVGGNLTETAAHLIYTENKENYQNGQRIGGDVDFRGIIPYLRLGYSSHIFEFKISIPLANNLLQEEANYVFLENGDLISTRGDYKFSLGSIIGFNFVFKF